MNEQVKSAVDELNYIRSKFKNRGHYLGEEFSQLKCKPVKQFPGITNLEELYAVLRKCWKKETAYPDCQSDWVASDPSYGQCAITAALVADMFDGMTIHMIRLPGGGTHYFNSYQGKYIDLTREQFTLYDASVQNEPNKVIPRNRCCTSAGTRGRYVKLQQNMMLYLNR